MLAIVTGTISPAPQMNQLVLRDVEERLKQYEESLHFLLCSQAFAKVVFCENSNFGTERLSYLTEIAGENGVELELLSFRGNVERACVHGKGYGEGEIMDYVFSHSELIRTETYFVKITGRLKVDNIKAIVSRMDKQRTYFNIPNHTRTDIYDTRIYGMPIRQFKDYFLDSYDKVMDEQGIFLEMVYTQILQEYNIQVHNFPRYPRIVGVSGSGGVEYGYTEWKCKIKDILGKFNFYKVKTYATGDRK